MSLLGDNARAWQQWRTCLATTCVISRIGFQC